ncbi:MAG: hypothetical protein HY692_01095 [Cyanobacteria bacterium NC_groundwater_1444_Ag_S-0.65um_54_12]|nr:hypothetical protein [Cyanobacteria bacterium NC_groundwater_1444_Ag_S-0.65um_54_12]
MPETMLQNSHAALDVLQSFVATERANSILGKLLGATIPERDQILDQEITAFESALESAKIQARMQGKAITLDSSGISLTAGGDNWTVYPDGKQGRSYSQYPGFDLFLSQIAKLGEPDMNATVATDTLLECAYHAFWSPSATNWQPMRIIELRGADANLAKRLARFTSKEQTDEPGDSGELAGAPVLLLLRREHYESLLGDVLEPFGLEVTAGEELIDAGIFTQVLLAAVAANGLAFREVALDTDQAVAAGVLAERVLATRLEFLEAQKLKGCSAHSEQSLPQAVAREIAKLAALHDALQEGNYVPYSVVVVAPPLRGHVTPFATFATLSLARSTQRVASPTTEYSQTELLALWEAACSSLPSCERELVHCVSFDWHMKTPRQIGEGMFEALYGKGANQETKRGGTGGILTNISVRNFLGQVAKNSPELIIETLGSNWQTLDDAELTERARNMPVRAQDLGRYLQERILRDGRYRLAKGILVTAAQKFVSVPMLVRMMKSLAATFGNFFLKFQNTHPQNAILLANSEAGSSALRAIGRVGAAMTYLARARGASSIIKSGPVDLARDAIVQILLANPDQLPTVEAIRPGLQQGRWVPSLTFQIGMPLAGSDLVDVGTAGEHTGLEERKRDKRPPRADFTDHYFPAF